MMMKKETLSVCRLKIMRRLGEQKWRNFIFPSKLTHGFSSKTNPNPNEYLINAISKSLLHNETWETLSTKYSTVDLSNSVIQQILLRFKQPETAKSALNFFHWSAHNRNLRHGISTYAVTIHILVKSRLLIDARALIESSISNSDSDLFNSLLDTYEIFSSTPLVFDLLVQCYAKLRNFEIGFEVFQKLCNRGFVLSVITFNTLLHYAVKSNRIDLVWRIYEVAIEKRTYPNETTIQIMISALCKEGKLKEVVDLLDKIQGKRSSSSSSSAPLIVNTSLVFRVLGENRIEDGMSLLKRLLQKNMVLDTIGYSIVVYAKIKQGDIESARKVFDEMLQRGFDANAFVYTGFVKACCEKGEIEEAERLINEMESSGMNPYDETFNYLIEGCARFGKEEGSLKYCKIMVERGLIPSCLVFNEMVERLRKIENLECANEILTKSIDNGFMPNEETYSHLIRGFVQGNDIEQALKLFYEMEYRKISPGFEVFRSLIVGLCACGKVKAGEKYLGIMKKRLIEPNADVYEALVKAFRKAGDKTNADRVYDEMMLITVDDLNRVV